MVTDIPSIAEINGEQRPGGLMIVTGTLPGNAGVGSIILRDLVERFSASLSLIVGLVHPEGAAAQDEGFADKNGSPVVKCLDFPHLATQPGRGWRKGLNLLKKQRQASAAIERCVERAVAEARQRSVDRVLVVLDGAAAMSVGWRVAQALGVPMLAYIWDHGPQVLRQQRLNRLLRRRFEEDFARSMRLATRGAVVSETMQLDYREAHGLNCVLLRHGVVGQANYAEATTAADHDREPSANSSDRPWTIGFAGTDYARSAWDCLLAALDRLEWRLAGRAVRVRVMGGSLRLTARGPRWIEFLGYRSPEEVAVRLRESDLNYLSHPFEPDWYEFSRYSFPTKLSSYVAAGAPILVHAPTHSSLDSFTRRHPMGPHCDHLDADRLAIQLREFAESPTAQTDARKTVAEVGATELNAERFFAAFADFIGVDVPVS